MAWNTACFTSTAPPVAEAAGAEDPKRPPPCTFWALVGKFTELAMWLLPVYNIDKTGLHEMSTFKQPLKTSKAAARSSPNAPWWSTAATKQATWCMAFRNQCPEGDLSHFNYTSIPSITQFLLQNGPLCFECTPPKAACDKMLLDAVSHHHGVMGRESHDPCTCTTARSKQASAAGSAASKETTGRR